MAYVKAMDNIGCRAWIVGASVQLSTAEVPSGDHIWEFAASFLDARRGARVAVLGGVPVNNPRLAQIEGLLDQVDTLIVGGGLANPFLKARGGRIGRSQVSDKDCELAGALLEKAQRRKVKILLPIDTLAANYISPQACPSQEGAMALFEDKIGMDIGPRTAELFGSVIRRAGAVVWSGAMGIWELPAFSSGTGKMIQALSATSGLALACGSNTVQAISAFHAEGKLAYTSTESARVLECIARGKTSGTAL